VICYPIRGSALYNIFAGHVTDEMGLTNPGRCRAASTNCSTVTAVGIRRLLEMLAQVSDCYKWGIRDRDPLTSAGRPALRSHCWRRRPSDDADPGAGRGDFAGGRLALARHLSNSRNDPVGGLAAYEAERRPRASRVVLQAREQFQNNRKNPAPPPLSARAGFSRTMRRWIRCPPSDGCRFLTTEHRRIDRPAKRAIPFSAPANLVDMLMKTLISGGGAFARHDQCVCDV